MLQLRVVLGGDGELCWVPGAGLPASGPCRMRRLPPPCPRQPSPAAWLRGSLCSSCLIPNLTQGTADAPSNSPVCNVFHVEKQKQLCERTMQRLLVWMGLQAACAHAEAPRPPRAGRSGLSPPSQNPSWESSSMAADPGTGREPRDSLAGLVSGGCGSPAPGGLPAEVSRVRGDGAQRA